MYNEALKSGEGSSIGEHRQMLGELYYEGKSTGNSSKGSGILE